jgi:hypothetical protein
VLFPWQGDICCCNSCHWQCFTNSHCSCT